MQEAVGLTGLQLSILRVLWDRGEATTQEVWREVAEQRHLALTTVATILTRLERKCVLTHRRAGRHYVYKATVSRAEVRRSKVRNLTETLFDGDPVALVRHLVRSDQVRADELERIRRALATAGASVGGDD